MGREAGGEVGVVGVEWRIIRRKRGDGVRGRVGGLVQIV